MTLDEAIKHEEEIVKEEKIRGLYNLKEYLVENPIELDGYKSLPITLIDYAIETLEQESILDKIRVEIKTEISDYEGFADFYEGIRFGLRTALEIIDEYKAESENKEWNL